MKRPSQPRSHDSKRRAARHSSAPTQKPGGLAQHRASRGLTPAKIAQAASDKALIQLLCTELERRDIARAASDEFVAQLRGLPPGLHAMASTLELDVSMALDDLGWHFGNWHHQGLAHETLRGLREFDAHEEAELFAEAMQIAFAHWDLFARDNFTQAYYKSDLEKAFDPLNVRLWELLGYWKDRARRGAGRPLGAVRARPSGTSLLRLNYSPYNA